MCNYDILYNNIVVYCIEKSRHVKKLNFCLVYIEIMLLKNKKYKDFIAQKHKYFCLKYKFYFKKGIFT